MARGIVSQCIETDKMLKALAADEGVDKYGKIKYPEMIAQILPYFSNTDPDNIDTKHLWFL